MILGLEELVLVPPRPHPLSFALYCLLLLTSPPFLVRGGVLNHSDIDFIWKPPAYPPELHPFLLAVLEKFEVLHRLEGNAVNNTEVSTELLLGDVNSVKTAGVSNGGPSAMVNSGTVSSASPLCSNSHRDVVLWCRSELDPVAAA